MIQFKRLAANLNYLYPSLFLSFYGYYFLPDLLFRKKVIVLISPAITNNGRIA